MPHYPDEIEYSDKYVDDHYEYRHVILPKDVYKKIPRSRLLTESVTEILSRNGEQSEFNSLAAGYITSSTAPNLTSSSSAEPKALIPRPAFLPLASFLHPMPSATDLPMIVNDANIQPLKTNSIIF